ncbi:hypothetical protein RhiLY_09486 [Ceratobasidium sp. AG-Ba]|nr:hypothetical protein RhiLY_09486 [Ceratobasidium sp. AG-Ba]
MAPYTPRAPSHASQDDHAQPRRTSSVSAGHHDIPARPPSANGQRFSQSYPLSPVSPPNSLLKSDLDSLKRYDLVFLVSDSPTMGQNGKWQKCGELLSHLARVAMLYDSDGIEIHFLNNDNERSDQNFSSEEDVEAMFQSVISPDGSSRLTDKLDLLVSEYRGQLRRYIDSNPAKRWRTRPVPKKAIYVVLTDGNHADTKKILDIISDMVGFLKSIQAPSTQFGIEFVQIGDSADFEWLHRARYQDNKVRSVTGFDVYNGGVLDDVQAGSMLLRPVSGDSN